MAMQEEEEALVDLIPVNLLGVSVMPTIQIFYKS
jgi:hypothetical protein